MAKKKNNEKKMDVWKLMGFPARKECIATLRGREKKHIKTFLYASKNLINHKQLPNRSILQAEKKEEIVKEEEKKERSLVS